MSTRSAVLNNFKGIEIVNAGTATPSGYSVIGYGSILTPIVPTVYLYHAYLNMQLGGVIYSFGNGLAKKYTIASNAEATLATNPINPLMMCSNGTDLFFRAFSSTTFRRYNVGANSWTTLTATTNPMGDSTSSPSMCYDSGTNRIFCFWGVYAGTDEAELQIYNFTDWSLTALIGSGDHICGQPYIDGDYIYTYDGRYTISTTAYYSTNPRAYNQGRVGVPQAFKYDTFGYVGVAADTNQAACAALFPAGGYYAANSNSRFSLLAAFPLLFGSPQIASGTSALLPMIPISKYGGWSLGDSIYGVWGGLDVNSSHRLVRLDIYKVLRRT